MRALSPLGFLFAALLALLALSASAVLLPHERYYRWQAHDSGTTRKADWIYERLHFDPTPIDVALVGTSRTAGGLSGPLVEAEFCRLTGRRIRVANLGIPETGRDMHYVIAKEAARTKRPALVFVELNEVEARRPHPGFIVLADARDVLAAPAFLNPDYLSALARLPGRQAHLFYASLMRRPALRPEFDRSAYPGRDLDRTQTIPFLDGRVMDKTGFTPKAELDAAFVERRAEEAPLFVLPAALRNLEYRFSRRYLQRIEDVVAEAGGQTLYVYVPAYRAPAMPAALMKELKARPDIDLGGLAAYDGSLWYDATHLDARGAEDASLRFAQALAELRPTFGRIGCGPS